MELLNIHLHVIEINRKVTKLKTEIARHAPLGGSGYLVHLEEVLLQDLKEALNKICAKILREIAKGKKHFKGWHQMDYPNATRQRSTQKSI